MATISPDRQWKWDEQQREWVRNIGGRQPQPQLQTQRQPQLQQQTQPQVQQQFQQQPQQPQPSQQDAEWQQTLKRLDQAEMM
jgi:hypothetical protein